MSSPSLPPSHLPQLDAAADAEATNVRDVQRQLDKTDFEVTRLRERLADQEAKNTADVDRCSGLERENRALLEAGHKRDRAVREERRNAEDALGQVGGVR